MPFSFLGRGGGGGGGGGAPDDPPASSSVADDDGLGADGASSAMYTDGVDVALEATLRGHGDGHKVWHAAWAPHGRTLATCSSDTSARLWERSAAAGGAWVTVAELEGVHTRTVRTVAWSPCGE